jgi:hypothetical protein
VDLLNREYLDQVLVQAENVGGRTLDKVIDFTPNWAFRRKVVLCATTMRGTRFTVLQTANTPTCFEFWW